MDRPQQNSKKKLPSQPNNFLKYTNLAFQLLVLFAVAGWGGIELDKLTGIKVPVFTIIFILVALVGVIYKLIKSTQ